MATNAELIARVAELEKENAKLKKEVESTFYGWSRMDLQDVWNGIRDTDDTMPDDVYDAFMEHWEGGGSEEATESVYEAIKTIFTEEMNVLDE